MCTIRIPTYARTCGLAGVPPRYALSSDHTIFSSFCFLGGGGSEEHTIHTKPQPIEVFGDKQTEKDENVSLVPRISVSTRGPGSSLPEKSLLHHVSWPCTYQIKNVQNLAEHRTNGNRNSGESPRRRYREDR